MVAVRNPSPNSPPALALTERELRFVDEYCVDLDHNRAAKDAGFPASTRGFDILRKPEVEAAIAIRLKEITAKSSVSAEWVRVQLREIVERCMQKVPVMEYKLNPESGRNELTETGEWKFESNGANKALELLGKHLGMFKESVVITVEQELTQLSKEELDRRVASILEERELIAKALAPPEMDLIEGPDGVFASAEEVETTEGDSDVQV